jgi:hypothetical protein
MPHTNPAERRAYQNHANTIKPVTHLRLSAASIRFLDAIASDERTTRSQIIRDCLSYAFERLAAENGETVEELCRRYKVPADAAYF